MSNLGPQQQPPMQPNQGMQPPMNNQVRIQLLRHPIGALVTLYWIRSSGMIVTNVTMIQDDGSPVLQITFWFTFSLLSIITHFFISETATNETGPSKPLSHSIIEYSP